MKIIDTSAIDPRDTLPRHENDWVYNGLDCCVTLEICHELLDQVDPTAEAVYDFSCALQAPVLDMQLTGIRLNQRRVNEVLIETREEISRVSKHLDAIIHDGIGVDLNWRSPKQLLALFYDVLGLKPIRKRNAQGRFSPTVNRDALERLAINFYAEPICNHILYLRDLDKKRQFLETKLDADGRMRAGYNIAGTNTGRLSSSESAMGTGTNNQNIERSLRSTFIADEGMKLANLDLEQADARNVGAVCWNLFLGEYGPERAGAYLDACESGDLHTYVCSLGWPERGWTGDQKADRAIADQNAYREFTFRDLAKRLGHGTNYMGLVNVSRSINMPLTEVEAFREKYYGGFPCIPLWHDWVRTTLKEQGYITTFLGRRRFFYGRYSDDNTLRAAIAYEPQSCTADQINRGMLELWRTGRVQILAQVHDSVLFQYREDEEHEIIPMAIKCLTQRTTLRGDREFIMPVEAQIGWNWGYGGKNNPHGLINWEGVGADKREAPTYGGRPRSFFSMVLG